MSVSHRMSFLGISTIIIGLLSSVKNLQTIVEENLYLLTRPRFQFKVKASYCNCNTKAKAKNSGIRLKVMA